MVFCQDGRKVMRRGSLDLVLSEVPSERSVYKSFSKRLLRGIKSQEEGPFITLTFLDPFSMLKAAVY